MIRLIDKIKDIHFNESGMETIEYALMAALLAIAIIIGGAVMGTAANDRFQSIANELT